MKPHYADGGRGVGMADETCSTEGCGASVNARGLCRHHYNAWYRQVRQSGPLPPVVRAAAPCSEPGCARPAHARGLCNTHYSRVVTQPRRKRERAADAALRPEAPPKVCSVDDCERPHSGRGLCALHYRRQFGKPRQRRTWAENAVRNAERTLRNGGLLVPPVGLPYHPIARTCRSCGALVTTPPERLRRESGRLIPCPECQRRKMSRMRPHLIAVSRRQQAESAVTATGRYQEWTDAELEMVDRRDLSLSQIAATVGRTVYAVRMKRAQRAANEAGRVRHGLFGYNAQGCRCDTCTAARDNQRERVRSGKGTHPLGGWNSECPCESCRQMHKAVSLARYREMQRETVPAASRNGYEWTGPELEIVARGDLTVREAALLLGRTYAAVASVRERLRTDPRKARLAGLSTTVARRAER